MDKELFRNGSGYVDITAYKALSNIEKEINNMELEFNRGEIFEYEEVNRNTFRKALIISADFRAGERSQSVILLAEEPKGEINVPIVCEGMMYADCGRVSFAMADRIGRFIRKATAEEMAQIDEGVAKCLGIKQKTVEVPVQVSAQYPSETHLKSAEMLARARTEAGIYKNLYEQLLEKVMG